MSDELSSRKGKRSLSSNDNNSFVKNVTSRVSALLPSTITKWFSSPSSSNAGLNGSAPVAETSDSSTEDEALETSVTQPPSKKMRFSSPSTSYHNLPETKCTSTNTDPIETVIIVQSPLSKSTFKPETKFVSTPLRSPDEERSILERDKEISAYKLQNSFTSSGNSIVKKRKSLFDTPINEKPYEKLPRIDSDRSLSQPYSKPGLLGSPFYSGKTRYGGASSSFINQPNIKHRKDTLVHNSVNNNNITISQTTRRVMELLENYSSPLIEAKRLSQFVRSPNTSDKSHTNNAYKTQELLVPSFAKILQIKKKSRLMDTTSAARQILASNSSSLPLTPYQSTKNNSSTNSKESTETFTTKMRTRLTRNRDKTTIDDSISTAPVHLPTAILQIDQNNLPKFTLGGSVKEPVSVSTDKTTIGNLADPNNTSRATVGHINSTTSEMPISENKISDNSSIELITSKPQKCINTNPYKFSSPVMILVGNTENSLTQSYYTFGSPERRIVEQSKEKETNNFVLIVGNESKKESKSISWKCNDCWVANNSDTNKCVCCGAKKPLKSDSKTNQCSVCKVVLDIKLSGKCVNCEKKDDDVKSTTKLSGNNSLTWKCNDCWVNNDKSLEKCVCCGAAKPKVGGNNPPVSNTKSDDTSDWKCSDCLIKNKKSDDKCVACGGGAKPTSTQIKCDLFSHKPDNANKKSDSMFLNILKSQSDKWECPNCLVSNDKNRSTCICCEAEKPGTIKEADIKSFNFASKQNITFKFGIDPKQTPSDKITEPSSIKLLDKTVNKAETNNNIVSKPLSYTFGIPKEKHSEKIITEEVTIAEETPKETFKFGISKPLDSTPVLNNFFTSTGSDSLKFTENVTPTNSKKVNETVQAVPNIEELNSTMPNNQSAPKPTALFGIPLNTSKSTTVTTTPVCGQTSTTAASKVSETTFTFSASGVKTPENFFTAAVTTASNTSSSFFTIQAHPTSVSADSFFPKSDIVHATSIPFLPNSELESSSLSLFNKTDTVSTTVASPSLSIGPVFSFGNNSQNAQTEKSKFNFSFGNKSEMPSLFSVPTSNTGSNILLGNGLASTSNALSGGNGLASANSVGGNGLPSSSLSSGMLPGSTKRDKILWSSSSEASSTKMSSGNSLELSTNSLSAVQSSNLFAGQAKKDTKWPPSQNTNSIGSIKLSSGNSLETSSLVVTPSRMFAPPEKKENMWSMSNENNNIFVTNAGTNNLQKPSNFSFGSSMQFNSNNVTAPAFGSAAQPQPQNIFGMSSQQNNQPSLFSTALQNQTPPNIFGTQSVCNTAPSVGMFGTSTASAAPTFGTPNLSIPTFDTAQHNPVPAPTFNFGASQTAGVFGFGQQQPQSQGGVYNFGAQAVGTPQRQFNIGTTGAPGTVSRRVIRKAVRRTTPR